VSARVFGGLLSGTSVDGIDALLLRIEGTSPESLGWQVAAFRTLPWDAELGGRIRDAMAPRGADAAGLGRLHVEIGEAFAAAFLALLDEAGIPPEQVEAIGSHGQTIWHEPPGDGGPKGAGDGPRGYSLQLGDPATIAERTGVSVVSDFRARDMAAGGHGAPLVPWCDRVLLHRPGTGRALQNLGGMGNVTFLPADGRFDGVLGFDTGPGVALLDLAAQAASGGTERWDEGGRRALRGRVDEALLASLLQDPFFEMPPPRSTGRERFGGARFDALVETVRPSSPGDWDDLLATLVELTARSIAASYEAHLPMHGIDEVVLAGGGARNPALVARIEAALPGLTVRTGAEALGIDPDAREAAAFALLAWAHRSGVAGSLPAVTGARGGRVLGSFTPGPGGDGAR
jgi:anhydro-N-acetylmuramic acid kinase